MVALVEIFLLGLLTGSRAMVPMAVLCWFLYTGKLSLKGTWAAWAGMLATAIIFSLLAAGEMVGDKLPRTPSRLAPMGLVARVFFGGLAGALLSLMVSVRLSAGVTCGLVGAGIGAFAFHSMRRWAADSMGSDLTAALIEDVVAIGGSIGVVAMACAVFS